MTLEFLGGYEERLNGIQFQATNKATGEPIHVLISHEAIQDHGRGACLSKAKEKHSKDDTEPDGKIWVTSADFQ